MTRTQIQLPDELYLRAKKFAIKRELSLAEIARRGIEIFMARFPEQEAKSARWQLPKVNGGGIKVPLHQLHGISEQDETARSLRLR